MNEEEKMNSPECEQAIDGGNLSQHKDKSNLKILYDKYYAGRDYHLKRFWENSLFIWTFLLICFTSYGLLMNKYIDEDLHDSVIQYFPILSSFICSIGIVLSILWFKMAKASKVWYEVYETVIWQMESFNNEFGYDDNYLIHNFWSSKDGKQISSPSKIVIAIGALLIAFWFLALGFGICISVNVMGDYTMTILSGCSFLLLFIFGCIGVIDLKSSTIRDGDSEGIFGTIKATLKEKNIRYKYLEVKNKKGCENAKIWLVLNESDKENDNIKTFIDELNSQYGDTYTIEISYIMNNDTNIQNS